MAEPLHCRSLAPEGDAPHPTVVLLHGRGTDESDLLGLAPAMPAGVLYVAVRAPVPLLQGGYAWWRDLRPDGLPTPLVFGQSLERLRAFLGALAERVPGADPDRLAVLGFSQGAAMAAALAAEGAVPARGFAVLSGFLPAFVSVAEGSRAVFVGHGTADRVVPVLAGRDAQARLAAAGAEVTFREYPLAHGIDAAEAADLSAWLSERLGLDAGDAG